MPKRDAFIAVVNTFKAASPAITDEQRKGLLRQALQQYGLSLEEARQILKGSGLVVAPVVNYFEVLGLSVEEFQNQSERGIATRVDAAHKELYGASLRAGGLPRPDGKTQEQWRTVLNQARETLKDPLKRREHLAILRPHPLNQPTSQRPTPQPKRKQRSKLNRWTAERVRKRIPKALQSSYEKLCRGNVSQFYAHVAELWNLVEAKNWKLTPKFEKQWCDFYYRRTWVFSVKPLKAPKFAVSITAEEAKRFKSACEPERYLSYEGEIYAVYPAGTPIRQLRPIFEFAYRKHRK